MANPYQPPESPPSISPPRRGIRWRLIPSAFLMLFGGLLALGVGLGFVIILARSPDIAAEFRSPQMFGGLLIGTAGILWVASGTFLWERKWWRAALGLVLGNASGVLGASFIHGH
jgi:hypothetical protein